VIISEKRDKKAAKYLTKDLPYPYTSKAQFERSLETPIGREWNTRIASQRVTMPKVTKKVRHLYRDELPRGLRTIILSDGDDHQTTRETILVPYCSQHTPWGLILDKSISAGKCYCGMTHVQESTPEYSSRLWPSIQTNMIIQSNQRPAFKLILCGLAIYSA
jgi:hypothetical protein